MYETYWRLKQKPFENTADPRFYYPAESHQAALLKLRYTVENRRGAALLAGPSGVGQDPRNDHVARRAGRGFHAVCPPRLSADADCRFAGLSGRRTRRRTLGRRDSRRADKRPPHRAVPGRQRRAGPARGRGHRRGPPAGRRRDVRGPAAAAELRARRRTGDDAPGGRRAVATAGHQSDAALGGTVGREVPAASLSASRKRRPTSSIGSAWPARGVRSSNPTPCPRSRN